MSQSCPRLLQFQWNTWSGRQHNNTLLHALRVINASLTQDGVALLNVGAKIDNSLWNADPAWELAALAPRASVIAFEGDTSAWANTKQALVKSTRWRTLTMRGEGGPRLSSRVRLLNEYVRPSSICTRLLEEDLPRDERLVLMKVDVDSVDLPLTHAVLRCGWRPRLIYVEFNAYVPYGIHFTALHGASATYAGDAHHGKSNLWPCRGASLALWESTAREYGYSLLTTNGHDAALFVEGSAQSLFGTSASLWCHAGPVDERGALVRKAWRPRGIYPPAERKPDPRPSANSLAVALEQALRIIDNRCNATRTPYVARIATSNDTVLT
jgi:hypothetical protein